MYWSPRSRFSEASGASAQHIALVLHDFAGGGSERVAIRLANAWVAAGRRVTLFCGSEDGPLAKLVSDQVTILPIAPRIARGRSSRVHLGRALAGMIRGARPDVVVGPGNYHAPILAAMLADLGWDRPAVVSKLSNPIVRGDRSAIAQAVFTRNFRRLTRPFDALVAMSPAFAAEAKVLLGHAQVASIPEPTLDAVPLPATPRARTGRILCIGRLARQKNFALALDAFALADRRWTLDLLGAGEEEAMLRARAERLGIARRVTFHGFVADVAPYLARADALLCTSLFEGYPAALVEALAAGMPVVTTPCSLALPEILADRSFGAVANATPAALAAALTTVLARAEGPAPAPLLELARRHQIVHSAREWLAVLDRAVSLRAGAMLTA